MKTKIRKQFTGKTLQSTSYKQKPGKTMTVPDQNLTIAELLDRHSRGVSLGAPDLKGEYFDTEIPRYEDLTDMLQHKKDLIEQQIQLEKEIEQEQFLKQKKREDEVSQEEKEAKASTEKDQANA
jgi:hypothetical protein